MSHRYAYSAAITVPAGESTLLIPPIGKSYGDMGGTADLYGDITSKRPEHGPIQVQPEGTIAVQEATAGNPVATSSSRPLATPSVWWEDGNLAPAQAVYVYADAETVVHVRW